MDIQMIFENNKIICTSIVLIMYDKHKLYRFILF